MPAYRERAGYGYAREQMYGDILRSPGGVGLARCRERLGQGVIGLVRGRSGLGIGKPCHHAHGAGGDGLGALGHGGDVARRVLGVRATCSAYGKA